MRYLRAALTLVVFGVLAQTTATAAVGRVASEFTVTQTGQASYIVPIEVTPGIRELQPTLALTYNSGGENGLLGVGWDLVGLSSIARCSRTLVQDGNQRSVQYDADDRFCLDGAKLRQTGASYGAQGSTYQTEIETFQRVTSYATGGAGWSPSTGPQYFEVYRKDGLIAEYGKTADSRIAGHPTVPRVWMLNRLRDRTGNYVDFKYLSDDGTPRPDEILYTGNTLQGYAPRYRLKFFYEERSDDQYGFVGGYAHTVTKRLIRIEVQANYGSSSIVRDYRLTYQTAPTTNVSRVSQLQQCAKGDCLGATTFGWQNGSTAFAAESAGPSANALATYLVDANNDGLTDLIWAESANWFFALGNGAGGFGARTDTGINHQGGYNRAVGYDYNNDGNTDLLYTDSASRWRVLQWNGSGFSNVSTTINSDAAPANDVRVHDVTGDGRPDLVFVSSGQIRVRRGTISGLAPTPDASAWASATGISSVIAAGKSLDFNGDGKNDLVTFTSAGCSFTCIVTHYVLLSTGSTFTQVAWFTSLTAGSMRAADVNGDSLTDLVFKEVSKPNWQVVFGTGAGVSPSADSGGAYGTPNSSEPLVLDYNADGFDDLLMPYSGAWHWIASTGTGFLAPQTTGVPYQASIPLSVGDPNGDGLEDLLYVQQGTWRQRYRIGPLPDLLVQITDGLGNTIVPTYAPLTDAGIYTKASGAIFPDREYQGSVYVVKDYVASTGLQGWTTRLSFKYEGARVHVQGRGFLGFQKRRIDDIRTNGITTLSGVSTEETYRQDYPYIGGVSRVATTRPPPNQLSLITEKTISYARHVLSSIAGQERELPYASEEIDRRFEVGGSLNGQEITRSTTTHVVDVWGRETQGTISVRDVASATNHVTTTAVTFGADDTSGAIWCFGRATSEQVTRSPPSGPAITRSRSWTHDYPQCRVSSETVEPNIANLAMSRAFAYDLFGNLSKVTQSASGLASRSTEKFYILYPNFVFQTIDAGGLLIDHSYDFTTGDELVRYDANYLGNV